MSDQSHDAIPDGHEWAELPDAKPDDGAESDAREPFPVDVLPEPLRSIAINQSARLGTCPSVPGLTGLTLAAGLVGNARTLAIEDDHVAPCVIWSAVIADPGEKKTPMLSPLMRPIETADAAAMRRYRDAAAEYAADQKKRKNERAGLTPPEPAARMIVKNTTDAAVLRLVSENPRGLVFYRDELTGLIASLGRYDKGKSGADADVSSLLEAWTAESMLVDRAKAEDSFGVAHVALSLCGGIQPEKARTHLSGENIGNGFVARFLLTMPPPVDHRWARSKPPVDEDAKRAWAERTTRLRGLDVREDDHGTLVPRRLELDRDATAAWPDLWDELVLDRATTPRPLYLASAKLRSYLSRVALVIALIRDPDTVRVTAADLEASFEIVRWCMAEAERYYRWLHREDREATARVVESKPDRLLRWIDEKHAGIAPQSAAVAGVRIIKNADERDAAVRVLEGRGDIVRRKLKKAGDGDQGGAAVYLCRADLDDAAITARGFRLCHELSSRHEVFGDDRDVA
ncbi:MAG: DUF3987 domain-containing protein [Planctomycetota bacterium]